MFSGFKKTFKKELLTYLSKAFRIDNFPKFLLQNYKNVLNLKLRQMCLIDPEKYSSSKNNKDYEHLTVFFYELQDNKILPFDSSYFSKEIKLLLFKIMLEANFVYIKNNQLSQEILVFQIEEFSQVMGINENISEMFQLVKKIIILGSLSNQTIEDNNKSLKEDIITLTKYLGKSLEKFLFIIFSFSLMLNNIITPEGQQNNNLICSARKNQILKHTLRSLELIRLTSEFNVSPIDVNYFLETNTFKTIFRGYSQNLFGLEQDRKVVFDNVVIVENLNRQLRNTRLENYIKEFLAQFNVEHDLTKQMGAFFNDIFSSKKKTKEEDILNRIDFKPLSLSPLDPFSISPHVTICISGYLSEKDRQDKNWENLVTKLYEYVDFYFYNWQATTKGEQALDVFKLIAKGGVKLLENKDEKKDNQKSDLKIIEDSFMEYCNNDNLFIKAKGYSMVFGKLLAYILVSRTIFKYQTFSLIGFSLGCSVIKNCIKELHKIAEYHPAANDIIQNVLFIAGATSFNKKEEWAKRFEVVGGRIINCHGSYDNILKILYQITIKQKAIGLEAQTDKNLSKIENYDFSYLKCDHSEYKKHMTEILEKIKLFR